MIEYFRHEALNQVSVISGFCEIIEHQLYNSEQTLEDNFRKSLDKIRRLSVTFNETLLVFREECVLLNVTEETILRAEPAGDISRYLSRECAIQYSVLSEIAGVLSAESAVLLEACGDSGKMTGRCRYIAASAERLNDLFLHPVAYLQEAVKANLQDDAEFAS